LYEKVLAHGSAFLEKLFPQWFNGKGKLLTQRENGEVDYSPR